MEIVSPLEIFRTIAEWPDYEVSSLGDVRRIDERWLRGNNRSACIRPNHKGYLRAHLTNRNLLGRKQKAVFVHRLVAEAFIPNPLNLPQINHIDGNKLNNRADNLQWVTNTQNSRLAVKAGVYDKNAERARKISEDAVFDIIDKLREGEVTRKSLADKYGVTPQYVGQLWTWYKAFLRYEKRRVERELES